MKYPPIKNDYKDDFIGLLNGSIYNIDLVDGLCHCLNCENLSCNDCSIFFASNEDVINNYCDVLIEYKLKKLEL